MGYNNYNNFFTKVCQVKIYRGLWVLGEMVVGYQLSKIVRTRIYWIQGLPGLSEKCIGLRNLSHSY